MPKAEEVDFQAIEVAEELPRDDPGAQGTPQADFLVKALTSIEKVLTLASERTSKSDSESVNQVLTNVMAGAEN